MSVISKARMFGILGVALLLMACSAGTPIPSGPTSTATPAPTTAIPQPTAEPGGQLTPAPQSTFTATPIPAPRRCAASQWSNWWVSYHSRSSRYPSPRCPPGCAGNADLPGARAGLQPAAAAKHRAGASPAQLVAGVRPLRELENDVGPGL